MLPDVEARTAAGRRHVLLCSDGLTGQVSDHEIGVIASTLPPDEACQFLVDLANLRGGPDNITVLIVSVRGVATAAQAPKPVQRRRPWYSVIPWPLLILCVGVVLAIQAVSMTAQADRPARGMIFFSLASICIVIGVGGLALHRFRERAPPEVVR